MCQKEQALKAMCGKPTQDLKPKFAELDGADAVT